MDNLHTQFIWQQSLSFCAGLCSQYRKECMDEGADFFFDKSLEFEKAIGVCKGWRGVLVLEKDRQVKISPFIPMAKRRGMRMQ